MCCRVVIVGSEFLRVHKGTTIGATPTSLHEATKRRLGEEGKPVATLRGEGSCTCGAAGHITETDDFQYAAFAVFILAGVR